MDDSNSFRITLHQLLAFFYGGRYTVPWLGFTNQLDIFACRLNRTHDFPCGMDKLNAS